MLGCVRLAVAVCVSVCVERDLIVNFIMNCVAGGSQGVQGVNGRL